MYLAGAIGLILICSAGLLMLRKYKGQRLRARFFVILKRRHRRRMSAEDDGF